MESDRIEPANRPMAELFALIRRISAFFQKLPLMADLTVSSAQLQAKMCANIKICTSQRLYTLIDLNSYSQVMCIKIDGELYNSEGRARERERKKERLFELTACTQFSSSRRDKCAPTDQMERIENDTGDTYRICVVCTECTAIEQIARQIIREIQDEVESNAVVFVRVR